MNIFRLHECKTARAMDLQLWMWSWGLVGVGLGAYYAGYIVKYIFLILLIGVAGHIWSMNLVYKDSVKTVARNKSRKRSKRS